MSIKINKNGKEYDLGFIPEHYPADRVYLDGDTTKNVQGAIDEVATPTFTEASTRSNINSGETISTLFGKIKKWFTDLKTVAFSGSYNDLSDKPTIPDISTKVSKTGDTMSGDLTIDRQNGTTSSLGYSLLTLGNNIPVGTAKNSTGILDLYSESGNKVRVYTHDNISATRYVKFPNKNGTVAMTYDIPEIYIITRTTSSSSYSITVPISTWDNYAIQLFGVGNSKVLTGVIAIQKAPTYVVSSGHITLDYSATGTISISKNSDDSITINGLQSNGHYTLISSKRFE